MKAVAVFLIKTYKAFLSPFFPQACRFSPSCSIYFLQAVERYGLGKGLWFSLKRLGKCHPFHPGGYDPVNTDSRRPR